jgi:hypothetical protein
VVTSGIGSASVDVTGDEQKLNPPGRLDDGKTDVAGDPVVSLGEDGATAYAWKARINGRGAVTMRERRADGVTSDKTISGPRGGPVVSLQMAGSGLGDGLVAFQQGGQQFTQIVGASIDAPPSTFNVQTPVDFINDKKITLAWDPAPHAIGGVVYSVTIDDEGVADSLTTTKTPAGDVDDGVHIVQVIATDSQGQQTTSRPGELKVDRTPPTASVTRKGKRVSVSLRDGAKDETAGVDESTVKINWGDGKHSDGVASASHTYEKGGTHRIKIGAKDLANNRAAIRKQVKT